MSEVPSQHKKLPTSNACMAASQFSALPTIRMMSCFLTTGLSPSPEPFSRATSPLVRVSSLGTATTAAGNSGWITVDTTSKSLDYNQSTPMIVISAISTNACNIQCAHGQNTVSSNPKLVHSCYHSCFWIDGLFFKEAPISLKRVN